MVTLLRNRMLAMSAVALLLTVAESVSAHHSTSSYDSSKVTTLSGTVTKVYWVNPHTYFVMSVTRADGKQASWSVLAGTPTLNVRNGWKYNDIKAGDKITAMVHPNRDEKVHSGILRRVTLADGRTILGPREFLSPGNVPGGEVK